MLSIIEVSFAIVAVIVCVILAFFLTKKLNALSTKNVELNKQFIDKLKETRNEQYDINNFTKEYCNCVFNISDTKELNVIFDEMDEVMDEINTKLDSVYHLCERERKKSNNTKKGKRFRNECH